MQIGVGSQKAARIERRARSKGIERDSRTGVSGDPVSIGSFPYLRMHTFPD